MARLCSVCQHADTVKIDEALVSGESIRKISARFGGISPSGMYRHKMSHLAASLVKAKDIEKASDATTLLQQVQELLQQARRLTDRCEHSKDLRGALTGVRAIGSVLELLGKVSGQLQTATTVNVVVALKGLDGDKIRETLLDAGHGNWMRIESLLNPEENERRIYELMAKGGFKLVLDGCLNDDKPN